MFEWFLPSKEDLENKEVKELSKRLMGGSYKETLTNIVEWQERNIHYWSERADMFVLLCIFSIIPLVIIPAPSFFKLILVFILLLYLFFNFMLYLTCILFLTAEIIVLIWIFRVINVLFFVVTIALSIPLGGILSLLLYGALKYRHIKTARPEFRFRDTFKWSLPVEKILEYRLAICRDYAKCTAALLLNCYRENKIYFIEIPSHVAAAIKIKDKLFVLDQKLPVLTLEKWMDFWNERMSKSVIFKISSYIFRFLRGGEVRISEIVFNEKIKKKWVCYGKLDKKDILQIDTENLTEKIANIMSITQVSNKSDPDIIITLRNFAICHDKDEIVEFSMLKAIKNKLADELCGTLTNITKIEIIQNEKDLILKGYVG